MFDDVVVRFADLFQGRMDAYGTADGGCDREPWPALDGYQWRVQQHLNGTTPMGVYPLRDDLTVMWGCSDFDDGERSLKDAINVAKGLRLMGVNAWVEISRSKGYHTWSFASEPVPAQTMRNALLAVHQALEVPAKEVNPKQTSLDGLKGFGNYVRACYPGALSTTNGATSSGRQMVFEPHLPPLESNVMTLEAFVREAWEQRSPTSSYEALAARYIPPLPHRHVHIQAPANANATELARDLPRDGWLAFTVGPKDGMDRSSSLTRLAHFCREGKLTASEAFVVVADADRRWGKFSDRPDGEAQIAKMIERAYG